ncbi:MAG: hypothetical protein KDA92_20670, partial [Planctomycetales bacterium]|nr:hypothetical protein [Planctomycetales bacterium]
TNFDDNWSSGFLVGSGESRAEFDGVVFKNGTDCGGSLFSTSNGSQLVLRDSEATGFWLCGGANAISARDSARVLVESSRIAIDGMAISDYSSSTVFSANGTAEIEVRDGVYNSSLLLIDVHPFIAIASTHGASHILLDGGSYSLNALGAEQTAHLVHAADDSTIELIAGSFKALVNRVGIDDDLIHLSAEDRSTIIVHGSDFNYPLGEVPDLAGTLDGKLVDGNPFRWNFARATDARILLVPEPTGISIGCLPMLLLARSFRRSLM